MGRSATEADFHGTRLNTTNRLYDEYRRFPFFAERATFIVERYPAAQHILVAGCGYGYLVDDLRELGVAAWGCDLSAWVLEQAALELGERARFVVHGDITNSASLAAVARMAGLTEPQRFDLTVTEDVLPVLDEAEIDAALVALRSVSTAVLHMVTPGDPLLAQHPGLTWRPAAAWRTRCAPDAIFDVQRGSLA